jgi:plastocyanin domain-containing protein
MTMIMVNLLGLALIALIAWWFWLYKPREVNANEGVVTIVVESGVYTPAKIQVVASTTELNPVILRFIRKDPSLCAGMLSFADLDISVELPLNQPVDVTLPPLQAGSYGFACQMQMYRGELIVVNQ